MILISDYRVGMLGRGKRISLFRSLRSSTHSSFTFPWQCPDSIARPSHVFQFPERVFLQAASWVSMAGSRLAAQTGGDRTARSSQYLYYKPFYFAHAHVGVPEARTTKSRNVPALHVEEPTLDDPQITCRPAGAHGLTD